MKFLEGKRTYTGIGIAATGVLMQVFGIDEATAQAAINELLGAMSTILEIVGLGVATWGRRITKAGAK